MFFLAPDETLMAVDVKTDPTFDVGIPTRLFETHVPSIPLVGNDRNQYLATSDGQRFLVNRVAVIDAPTPITLFFNWTALMKK